MQVFPESSYHPHPAVKGDAVKEPPGRRVPTRSNFFQGRGFFLVLGLRDDGKEVSEGQRRSPPSDPRKIWRKGIWT